MNKIRILRVVNRFNLGGITFNVSYLSRYMPENYETMLAGGPEEKDEASSLFIPASLGLHPFIVPEMQRSINPFSDFAAYRKIKRLIRQHKPQIVHTHASKAGAIGRLAAIHMKVPVIVHTFHGHVFSGYFGYLKTAIYKTIERYLAKRSTALVAISDIQKQELTEVHRICSPDKMRVINLGFDLQKFNTDRTGKRSSFRAKYNFNNDEIVLGIIGRLAPVKNHELFINAVAACKRRGTKKIRAVIVGDGERKQHIISSISANDCTYTETPGENADFVFTGWIKEVDGVLPGLDIVCLTSKNEGTPVSLIEAQAASTFIVSTDVGGIKDILHPDCGLLAPPGNTSAYAEQLLAAITNHERYKDKAGRAAEAVIKHFSYQRLCTDMDKLYRELLTKAEQKIN